CWSYLASYDVVPYNRDIRYDWRRSGPAAILHGPHGSHGPGRPQIRHCLLATPRDGGDLRSGLADDSGSTCARSPPWRATHISKICWRLSPNTRLDSWL